MQIKIFIKLFYYTNGYTKLYSRDIRNINYNTMYYWNFHTNFKNLNKLCITYVGQYWIFSLKPLSLIKSYLINHFLSLNPSNLLGNIIRFSMSLFTTIILAEIYIWRLIILISENARCHRLYRLRSDMYERIVCHWYTIYRSDVPATRK